MENVDFHGPTAEADCVAAGKQWHYFDRVDQERRRLLEDYGVKKYSVCLKSMREQ
jgi:hypothetical protein